VALLLVLIARPLAGWVGLTGNANTTPAERVMVSSFRIRGLGSISDLAYGVNRFITVQAHVLWTLTALRIFTSLVVHAPTARPAMARLAQQRAHRIQHRPGPGRDPDGDRDGSRATPPDQGDQRHTGDL
jgi:sodium/hydrogen antiporter